MKSQTGSGKTTSFGIPLCEMVEWEENKPQALVLTPTRACGTGKRRYYKYRSIQKD